MIPTIEPFPVGSSYGELALKLTFDEDDKLGDGAIAEARAHLKPGISMIWIESKQWSKQEWSSFLLRLIDDEALSVLPFTSIMKCTEEHWSMYGVGYVVDMSDAFCDSVDRDTIYTGLSKLVCIPNVEEVIWRNPPMENVTPTILNIVSEMIQPADKSWLYVKPELMCDAVRVVASCDTRWGIRCDT